MLSDLSVFHRITDPGTLSIRRFLAWAVRLPVYKGAVAAALSHPEPAGMASTAGEVPTGAARAGGDTPPEVIEQIKKKQFAERYKIDPSAITWDDDAIYRELVG